MIRAIRPNAMAQDDAAPVAGWNISPNVAWSLTILPGPSSCGVLLTDAEGVLVASGAALTGTAQACVLTAQAGQSIGMVDPDLGWHLLLTTGGTEPTRSIGIGPAVDLPDEIHPIYAADDLALARATDAINQAAHYADEITVTCPLGLGAGLGEVVSAPVDGVATIGQVESITWTATATSMAESATIRRHVAIAPTAVEIIVPPTVADDAAETDAVTTSSGNVLTNDDTGLTVVAVNGLSANVGQEVAGSDGGVFVVDADGSWTFAPDGDFSTLEGEDTATTSVTYHASDGTSEAMATLTITVTAVAAPPMTIDGTNFTIDGNPVMIG